MAEDKIMCDFEIETDDPPPVGGQVAIFDFADGAQVEIQIPRAVAVGGGGDQSINKPWWILRRNKVVVNEGPLADCLRQGSRAGGKQ